MSDPAVQSATAESVPLEERLRDALSDRLAGVRAIEDLHLLSGGASQESWSFDAVLDSGARRGLILRRTPGGTRSASMQLSKQTEATLQVLARAAGVPVAEIVHVLEDRDAIGAGYVMQRVEGETIARRILRDDEFAHARSVLAGQCGEAAARIHSIDRTVLPPLREMTPGPQLEQYRGLYDDFGDPHPVFEWAFRWLAERAPQSRAEPCLVHGDFRHGNIIVGPEGLRAVLDWEGAHIGDPMEDLAWICMLSWRFGVVEQPVGGFGRREDLFAGYEAAGGGKVDAAQVRWWEIFGSLKWGIQTQSMGFSHLRGVVRSMEKATIGRRASETEIDLLNLILVEEGL